MICMIRLCVINQKYSMHCTAHHLAVKTLRSRDCVLVYVPIPEGVIAWSHSDRVDDDRQAFFH